MNGFKPSSVEGRIYTAYRAGDQTLMLGYCDNIDAIGSQLRDQDFVMLDNRRGTRQEQQLLLHSENRNFQQLQRAASALHPTH